VKDKLQSIFVAFVRKTCSKERVLDLIDDLLDIVYDHFAAPDGRIPERLIDQEDSYADLKEACDKDEV
jgi:hypothetical protein